MRLPGYNREERHQNRVEPKKASTQAPTDDEKRAHDVRAAIEDYHAMRAAERSADLDFGE